MRWTLLVTTAIMLGLGAAPAAAQSATSARRWQVEAVGGLSLFELPKDGTATLPPAGPPLTTSGPTNPSRQVPTWFIGDGAMLLNGVNAEFGIAARITPLDSAISTLSLRGANAPAVGLRLRRIMNDRLSIEFSADLMPGSRELSPELVAAVEQTRASFVSAFNGLLTSGPFTKTGVNASATTSNGSSRDLATTLAAQWRFKAGQFEPYLTLGGGLVHNVGSSPSVTLFGQYHFYIADTVPISESDSLRLRYEQGTALVGVVGGGFRRALSERLGVSVDARVLLGKQTLNLRLESTPAVVAAAPPGFIESFTTPAIQFSNNSSTGRASTLSGEALDGFKAFSTSGLQTRYVVTAGIFLRF
ncbi:MAG TPA: hypothetical protein VMZ90_00745 [Vicinamibacterales bacterium]|nr:hypothetical protein [Vicinamibacterales bacterium]